MVITVAYFLGFSTVFKIMKITESIGDKMCFFFFSSPEVLFKVLCFPVNI